jgi:hypothetical protein
MHLALTPPIRTQTTLDLKRLLAHATSDGHEVITRLRHHLRISRRCECDMRNFGLRLEDLQRIEHFGASRSTLLTATRLGDLPRAKNKDFSLQCGPQPDESDHHASYQSAEIAHRDNYQPIRRVASDVSVFGKGHAKAPTFSTKSHFSDTGSTNFSVSTCFNRQDDY